MAIRALNIRPMAADDVGSVPMALDLTGGKVER